MEHTTEQARQVFSAIMGTPDILAALQEDSHFAAHQAMLEDMALLRYELVKRADLPEEAHASIFASTIALLRIGVFTKQELDAIFRLQLSHWVYWGTSLSVKYLRDVLCRGTLTMDTIMFNIRYSILRAIQINLTDATEVIEALLAEFEMTEEAKAECRRILYSEQFTEQCKQRVLH